MSGENINQDQNQPIAPVIENLRQEISPARGIKRKKIYNEKYTIIRDLSKGAYGQIYEVEDATDRSRFAMKTMQKEFEKGEMEINILTLISSSDPDGKYLCVKMIDSFHLDENGAPCMVFEMLGSCLCDPMIDEFEKFPFHQIRDISYQLCSAVKFLHDNKIIHMDIKPENIMFLTDHNNSDHIDVLDNGKKLMKNTDIKLIDFGSAIYDLQSPEFRHCVITPNYRAPEYILGLELSKYYDVWSLGCILFELFVHNLLFYLNDGDDYYFHIAQIEVVAGEFPQWMQDRTKRDYFTPVGKEKLVKPRKEAERRNRDISYFKDYRKDHKEPNKTKAELEEDTELFFDLMPKLLKINPLERMQLSDVVIHPFFDKILPERRIS